MTGCPGCGVGPEDECLPGCHAAALVTAGWSPDQAGEILQGRLPVELVVAPADELLEALTVAELPDPELIAALTIAVEVAKRCDGDPYRMAQVSLALLAFTRQAAEANGMTALVDAIAGLSSPLQAVLDSEG